MQRERSVSSYKKKKKFLNTCEFSQQADKHQHQDLGGGVINNIFGRSVLCDPRTLYQSMLSCNVTTLAIVDVCLCTMRKKPTLC